MSTQAEWEEQLRAEGFKDVYIAEDGPNVFYPVHVHGEKTAHVILEGEMTLVVGETSRLLRAGDRCDVPGDEPHSAKMGTSGCMYLVGEK